MSVRSLPDLRHVRRLLIIRLSAIGDVVHALPLASALKDSYPHLEITWLVEEIPADVVLGNPDLTDVIVLPRSRWKRGRASSPTVWREYLAFLADIRRRHFDVTIDLQGYAKSALIALASGARHRIGWWRLRDGANMISHAVPRRPESLHRVDWFLDVARELGVDKPQVRFPFHIPQSARDSVFGKLVSAGVDPNGAFAVINQASGNPPRRWGRSRFAEVALRLAERYRMPAILIGTAPESADCEAIVLQVRSGMDRMGIHDVAAPVNLAGATDLKELAALLDACVLHISGDTGSTHIAAALDTPVVAFYGSTDPAHAGPWAQSERVLARRELCSDHCTIRKCVFACEYGASGAALPVIDGETRIGAAPGIAARCLAAISVDDAMEKIAQVLAQTGCAAEGPRCTGDRRP